MQSEKKVTKYLKSKDLDDDLQLQQDVNIMIKQAFGPNSEFGQVTELSYALIKLKIDTMPSTDTLMRFLEDDSIRNICKLPPDVIRCFRKCLHELGQSSEHSDAKTPQTKLKSSAQKGAAKYKDSDSDGRTESEDDDMDFEIQLARAMSKSPQDSTIKNKEQGEDHVLENMKQYAKKLTVAEFAALVRYRRKPKTIAKCQQKAAEILRRAVDSEFHSLLDLSHTCSSAIDVQASMHLKSLMTRYYKLGSNASFAQ